MLNDTPCCRRQVALQEGVFGLLDALSKHELQNLYVNNRVSVCACTFDLLYRPLTCLTGVA